MTNGQVTFFHLFNEMDVKGTLSGKQRIFNLNGTPCDVLGYMLQRLGYNYVVNSGNEDEVLDSSVINLSGIEVSTYDVAAEELGIEYDDLEGIYAEIDREDSTNDSIRRVAREICELPG
jgi:hypothetical protein